ncbi:MAG: putative baseplate assembly protein [Bacteroidota bacterium]
MSKKNTSNCGCCNGIAYETPISIFNEANLSKLEYRIGTYGHFKAAMIRGLSADPALGKLTTRSNTDASLAMIDAWAVVLDILTFYQERIANEGYLTTARERLSLFELAKHISYRPKPGVAAHTHLAFTMDDAVGAPLATSIDQGTKVQSIPEKDENPQLFETLTPFAAKTKWNAIRPKRFEAQVLQKGDKQLYLKGITNQVGPGDVLLIVGDERKTDPGSERWDVRIVHEIVTHEAADYTTVKWLTGLGHNYPSVNPTAQNQSVFVFRERAALFGHNAPDAKMMSKEVKDTDLINASEQWTGYNDTLTQTLQLDNVYPKLVTQSWLALVQPSYIELYRLLDVDNISIARFGLSAKVAQVQLDTDEHLSYFNRRNTDAFIVSEALEMGETPIDIVVSGNSLVLDDDYPDLTVGHALILSGELEDAAIVPTALVPSSLNQPERVSELVYIQEITTVAGHTQLYFDKPLEHRYRRDTVYLNANTIYATHGDTKIELLGSGDAAQAFQRFPLKQQPLTFIPAASITGTATTLSVRVDDILWHEVPTFYGTGPEERIYIVRQENDGSTYVQFGDGLTGARLPTGTENIQATYRVGIGTEGLLKAEQLSLLMTPQLGLRSVINPLPTKDADDPEAPENIRQNAPLTVLTLDRIVSIHDYEDFTQAFAGIGKAKADVMWQGEDRTVHLTVAAVSPTAPMVSDSLITNLLTAINTIRHDTFKVVVSNFTELTFGLTARVKTHPDYETATVLDAIQNQLVTTFSFEERRFAQDVTPSEVIAHIQTVEGVVYVDLDTLNGIDIFDDPHFRLVARQARWAGQNIAPAELLIIDPDAVTLSPL